MDKRELLAMLTAHGVTPGKVYGGTPTLTAQDVAGMMAKCSDCESALLRAKYCGESESKAWAYWFQHLMGKGWHSEAERGKVLYVADLTFNEHIKEPRCKACNGTREVQIDSKTVVCPQCEGRGYKAVSDREIARKLNLPNGRLRGVWAERVAYCRRKLVSWEDGAIAKMA